MTPPSIEIKAEDLQLGHCFAFTPTNKIEAPKNDDKWNC